MLRLLFLLPIAYACNFAAVVNSESNFPIWAQFTFHNDTKGELMAFDFEHKLRKIRIVGPVCNMKPTVLRTWKDKKPVTGDEPPFGVTTAFLEGMGEITYQISDSGPHVGSRAGVACGFGECGGHG